MFPCESQWVRVKAEQITAGQRVPLAETEMTNDCSNPTDVSDWQDGGLPNTRSRAAVRHCISESRVA
ncbi:MAG: hypothetical protein Fues2KO_09360 [Fuerstiella sp.]